MDVKTDRAWTSTNFNQSIWTTDDRKKVGSNLPCVSGRQTHVEELFTTTETDSGASFNGTALYFTISSNQAQNYGVVLPLQQSQYTDIQTYIDVTSELVIRQTKRRRPADNWQWRYFFLVQTYGEAESLHFSGPSFSAQPPAKSVFRLLWFFIASSVYRQSRVFASLRPIIIRLILH